MTPECFFLKNSRIYRSLDNTARRGHNLDIKSSLENQFKKQEMKDSGWRFITIDSITT